MAKTHEWGISDSENLFSIKEWGDGYFTVNKKGHIAVCPKGNCSPDIDLIDVINELQASHSNIFPIAIRFTDILRNQTQRLRKSFQETIRASQYQGKYFGVYPIKVNQLCGVVEEIANAKCQMGLEAGSKAELLAILSTSTTENTVTILNGYKNEDYMKMAFIGSRLKDNLTVVIEKLSEIHLFLKLAREHTAIPSLGVRVKLTTESSGKWRDSSGFNSKFGLVTSEILMLIDLLREEQLLHKLKLIHFHLGSQIPNIHTLKESIIEGARVYSHLKKLCPQLEYINTGGGLGIDYDGSATASNSSRNYKLKEYTDNIVQGIMQICDEENVAHPHIITENGRALTAHHSCIVTNIVNQIQTDLNFDLSIEEEENALLQNIRDVLTNIKQNYRVQLLHDATNLYQHSLQAFKMGILSITERAKIEVIYLKILQEVSLQNALQKANKNLPLYLSSHYICNFSVFQSVIDHWAIEQLIPIVPIQRLQERPTNYSMLADITCDSDGKIKKYVTKNSNKNHIPLHDITNKEKYLLGIFLTGAYQDVMGDNHNLLGRINQVYISHDETAEKNFRIDRYVKGSSVKDLLKVMHYDTKSLRQKLCEKISQKYRDSSHLQDYLNFCSTYLEDSTYI
ncbi:biosynthetic arginine decarboxylase [Candidatus Uabimicrobium amorphum]|uniref:Arginine decarboxylase n=1 Tax=Uabimicrobium amorphum TaxID=2596890 RepID=A0A5S9F8A2_UABAM|nr:biosynthetic arginine decarboxylase [Candidatus Uabimicrobium amorphum]BBM88092.1 Biosynthetic arginine decarboxylase [Candidatus Uabimicrobium amorphum]